MTKIKICGLKNQAIVETTVEAGADYLGFVFAPSTRQVTAEMIREITTTVPKNIQKVGVFVSPTLKELQRTIEIAQIDFVQIHGDIPTYQRTELAVPIIQALNGQAVDLSQQIMKSRAEHLLLDAPMKNHRYAGGNGQVFDWSNISGNLHQQLQQKTFWIAGGLTTENVQEAIAYFQPYGVDVSSAVETDGVKDHQKIQAFIKAVKESKNVSTTR